MLAEGFVPGEAGLRAFSEAYGVLEKVTVIEPKDNVCSEARVTKRVKRRPGASPLLFGRFLLELGAFVSLEDISDALPPYQEEVISIEMDAPLASAYADLERDIKDALQAHPGNQSVISTGMNALLLYPDRPFGLGDLIGYAVNEDTGERERFVISSPADLDQSVVYAKERRLVEEVKAELAAGRRCQVYAVYTQKRDVTQRWKQLLVREGIRVEVLTMDVPPEAREAWYERQLRNGMQVCICHPKLVQTGLDLLAFPTIIFGETGYSIYVLRQASRRSWRIGQKQPVRVKFLHYAGTMQESCLRLMGKKLLVSLALEGKFANDGLQAFDDDDDMLTAMARELVTQKGVGERADELWRQLQRQTSDACDARRGRSGVGARGGDRPARCRSGATAALSGVATHPRRLRIAGEEDRPPADAISPMRISFHFRSESKWGAKFPLFAAPKRYSEPEFSGHARLAATLTGKACQRRER